jgi:phage terminase large subunit
MAAVWGYRFGMEEVSGIILCARQYMNSLDDSSLEEVKRAIQDEPFLSDYYDLGERYIKSRDGRISFAFAGLDRSIASIKSKGRILLCWVDEAEPVSEAGWSILVPTLREEGSDWNTELWVTWNPARKGAAVERRFWGSTDPRIKVVELNWRDNPKFPALLERARVRDLAHRPEQYAHVWEGGFDERPESLVFRNWKTEEFDRPPGTIHRLGADWGYSIDPSVMVRCSIDGNRLYVDYEAWQLGCEIVNLPELFMAIPEAEKWPSVADSSRPETISHLRKNGFPKMQAAIKGAKSLEEGVAFLQSFDIVVHPRCQHVIDELTLYRYKTDPLTGQVLPLLEDKNNHCIDALRYACEGARRAGKPKLKTKEKDKLIAPSPQGWMRNG